MDDDVAYHTGISFLALTAIYFPSVTGKSCLCKECDFRREYFAISFVNLFQFNSIQFKIVHFQHNT